MSSHLSRTPQNSVASDIFQDPGESQIVAIHDNNNILQPFNMNAQVQNQDIYRFSAPNHLIVNEYRQYRHSTLQNIFIEHNGQTGQRITQLEGWANVENNLVKRLEEKIELLAVWGQERESEVVQLIKVVNDQKERISALENLFQIRDVQLGEFSSRIQEKQIPETQLELQKQQKIIQELSQKVNQCFQQNSSSNNNIQQKKAKVSEEEIKARKARIAELYKNEDKGIFEHINKPYVFHKVKADGNCFYRSIYMNVIQQINTLWRSILIGEQSQKNNSGKTKLEEQIESVSQITLKPITLKPKQQNQKKPNQVKGLKLVKPMQQRQRKGPKLPNIPVIPIIQIEEIDPQQI